MEQIVDYIKPELVVAAVALYFIGAGLKRAKAVEDRFIPLILGGIGIALSAVYVLAVSPINSLREAAMALFTAVVQGILAAGASTYVNQIIKQANKKS